MMKNDALAIPTSTDAWRASEWQRLWLSVRSTTKGWRSLALVPAGRGANAQALLNIAVSLARTGMVHIGAPIHVADATNLTLAQLEPFTEALNAYVEQGDVVLVALAPVADSVATLPLARATDAALLCVVSGLMSLHDARQTVSQVGAPRFIGSAMFQPPR